MNLRLGGFDLLTLQNAGAVPRNLRGAITYVAGTTGAIGTTTLFTVTGDVLVSLNAKATTTVTSGGIPTWTLGVTGFTDVFDSSGFPDVTGWSAGKWADSVAGDYNVGASQGVIGAKTAGLPAWFPISANIIQTIDAATITGGVVRWYLSYIPLSADGAVALHANLVAF